MSASYCNRPTYLSVKTKAKITCISLHLLKVENFVFVFFERVITVLQHNLLVPCYHILSYESFIQLFYVESTERLQSRPFFSWRFRTQNTTKKEY